MSVFFVKEPMRAPDDLSHMVFAEWPAEGREIHRLT